MRRISCSQRMFWPRTFFLLALLLGHGLLECSDSPHVLRLQLGMKIGKVVTFSIYSLTPIITLGTAPLLFGADAPMQWN